MGSCIDLIMGREERRVQGWTSGLADFENTVDRESFVIFDADSGLCLSYVGILGPK